MDRASDAPRRCRAYTWTPSGATFSAWRPPAAVPVDLPVWCTVLSGPTGLRHMAVSCQDGAAARHDQSGQVSLQGEPRGRGNSNPSARAGNPLQTEGGWPQVPEAQSRLQGSCVSYGKV